MIDLYKISLYVITIISIVGTPGPVVLLVINVSLKHGFLQGVKTIIGTNVASLVLMSIASMAVMGLISVDGGLLNWISLIGALYLLFLAIRYFVDGYKMDQSQNTSLNIKTCGGFKQGFFVAISNPKDIIFFIALFPQFVSIASNKTTSLVILSVVWCLLDWLILLTFTMLSVRIFKHKKATKYIAMVSGVLIGIIAIIGLINSTSVLFAV